jgi:hypothetical protein
MIAIARGTTIVNAETGQRVGSACTEADAHYLATAMNTEHTDIKHGPLA